MTALLAASLVTPVMARLDAARLTRAAFGDWPGDAPWVIRGVSPDCLLVSEDGNGTILRVACRGQP